MANSKLALQKMATSKQATAQFGEFDKPLLLLYTILGSSGLADDLCRQFRRERLMSFDLTHAQRQSNRFLS